MHGILSRQLGVSSENWLYFGAAFFTLASLFVISQYNFLLFHGVAEIFSIAVAWSVFLLVWNTRGINESHAMVFLGVAYFFVGIIDLVHTLAYKGTGYFPLDTAANFATQLWIAARVLEAVSLLCFPFLLKRTIKVWPVFWTFTLVTALILASILLWKVFPDCYREGQGLTPFKKGMEYLICLVLVGTLVLLARLREFMDQDVHRLMMWAIVATIAAELCFTFYISVYSFSNVVGHFFKIVSCFFVYFALVKGSLTRPYATLFRHLEREKALHKEQRDLLDSIFKTTPDLFCLKDAELIYRFANPAFCRFLGKPLDEIIGKSDFDLFPQDEAQSYREGDRKVLSAEGEESGDYLVSGQGGKRWLRVSKTPHFYKQGVPGAILCSVSDISTRKQMELVMTARLRLLEASVNMTLAEVLRATLDEVEAITDSHAGFYHFFDEPSAMLTLQAWSTKTAERFCRVEGSGSHYPVSQAGVWVECVHQRQPVIHNDYPNLPNKKCLPPGHVPLIRELVVPVFRAGEIVAILGVGNKPSDYDRQDVSIVTAFADLAWDIAERKRAEVALVDSKAEFQGLVEASPSGIWQADSQGNTVYVSTRWTEITTMGKESIIGMPWYESVHPDDKERVRLSWQEAVLSSMEYRGEFRYPRTETDVVWVLCIARRIGDSSKGSDGWVGTISDISAERRIREQLRETLERYELVMEGTTGGVWDWDVAAKKVVYSKRWKELHGYGDEEIGDSETLWSDGIHPDDKAMVMAGVQAHLEGKTPYFEAEYRIGCRDGSWRWIIDRGKAIRSPSGEVLRMAGSEVDITAKIEARNQASASQARLQQALEAANAGTWEWDLASNENIWSDELYRLYDLDPRCYRASYESWRHSIAPVDRDKVEREVLRAASEEEEIRIAWRVNTVDGSLRWLMSRGQPQRDEKGKVIRYLGTVIDITELKQAEQNIVRMKNLLDEGQRVAHLGFFEYVDATEETVWSEEEFRIYGLDYTENSPTYAELLGRFVHPDDVDMLQETFTAARESGSVFELEHRIVRPDMDVRWVANRANPFFDEDGRLLRYVGTTIDITERKSAELKEKELRLQYLQAQKMESVGRLAGGVAHDFNNMLGVIVGHGEMLLEQMAADDALRDSVQEILKAAQHSASLTRQLLAFARKQVTAPEVLDLNTIITSILKILRRLIGENITLVWDPGSGLGKLKMDPSQIDQILANLCVNARDAIADTGTVTIATKAVDLSTGTKGSHGLPTGNYVLLSVSDTGCGMSEETIANIFEPFYTTKGLGKGTGLGLATVYGIVTQNGGVIDVSSELYRGTTFSIYLPVSLEERAADGVELAEVEGGGETVLAVEDDPQLLAMIASILERLGYRVLCAETPSKGILLARQYAEEIKLVLTDVIMPGMNGRELLKEIRTFSPRMKGIYMSGYTADVIDRHGVLSEGVAFVQKPFTKKSLAEKIRTVLDTDG